MVPSYVIFDGRRRLLGESHKMKALLLAAGFGERLWPITEMTPKCLASIGEKPLLQHWLECLADSCQFDEVIVNTHYLAGEVVKFASNYGSPIRLNLSHEEQLLGPGGTLLKHRSILAESDFLVAHADNFSIIDWPAFFSAHAARPKGCVGTMMTFDTDSPSACGIVETDAQSRLVEIHEKVANPPGNLANAAVFIFTPQVFEIVDKTGNPEVYDISRDILPLLLQRLMTFKNTLYHKDIGTPEALAQAQRDYSWSSQLLAASEPLEGISLK